MNHDTLGMLGATGFLILLACCALLVVGAFFSALFSPQSAEMKLVWIAFIVIASSSEASSDSWEANETPLSLGPSPRPQPGPACGHLGQISYIVKSLIHKGLPGSETVGGGV